MHAGENLKLSQFPIKTLPLWLDTSIQTRAATEKKKAHQEVYERSQIHFRLQRERERETRGTTPYASTRNSFCSRYRTGEGCLLRNVAKRDGRDHGAGLERRVVQCSTNMQLSVAVLSRPRGWSVINPIRPFKGGRRGGRRHRGCRWHR
jgi:hypothetical protein